MPLQLLAASLHHPANRAISVPSFGAMPLQFLLPCDASRLWKYISVPSFGAMPLQFVACSTIWRRKPAFQSPRSGLCLCNLKLLYGCCFYSEFQSPRSGLCLCNITSAYVLVIASYISVPSFGAMPLQFSPTRHHVPAKTRISVPSFGTMPLQWCLQWFCDTWYHAFQSPRSGLCLCNVVRRTCSVTRTSNFSPLVRGYASAIHRQ